MSRPLAYLLLRRTHRSRGTATVEAVIALPVLLLILFSVLYAQSLQVARQRALVEARRCAWKYAIDGCGRAPAGCPSLGKAGEVSGSGAAARDIDRQLQPLRRQTKKTQSFLESLSNVPVLGSAIEGLFGEKARAIAVREVDRPAPYGGGKAAVQGEIVVTCNTRPQSRETMIEELFKTTIGKFF